MRRERQVRKGEAASFSPKLRLGEYYIIVAIFETGTAGTERRRAGGGPGSESPAAPQEAAPRDRGTPASEPRAISLHISAGTHLGQLRVAARSRALTVRRELRHQHGRRANARPPQQEGAREAPRRHEKVPPGQHRSRHQSPQDAQLRPTGILHI